MSEFSHICGNERYKACDDVRTNAGNAAGMGQDNGFWGERQQEAF